MEQAKVKVLGNVIGRGEIGVTKRGIYGQRMRE